jgi:hypothetical protein
MTDLILSSPTALVSERASTADVLRSLVAAPLPPSREVPEPVRPLDAGVTASWQELTTETVAGYLAALLPIVQGMQRVPPFQRLVNAPVLADTPGLVPVRLVGAWECFYFLGRGGHSPAMAARHVETGQFATVKLVADGELLVAAWVDFALPRQFLEIYEWGEHAMGSDVRPWVAREPAVETLADHIRERHGARLPLVDILSIFRTACEGVATLHDQRIYRWSAHARNVFRVGTRWKLGDLGRCVLMTTATDPRLVRFFHLDETASPAECAAVFAALPSELGVVRDGGLCAYDPYLAHRLVLDDLSMLGGLLVDLLAANRWQVFGRALATECRGCYDLTGQRQVDVALSGILNRCWLGDGGGALALVFGQEETWEPFEDAGELFEAVASVMGVS